MRSSAVFWSCAGVLFVVLQLSREPNLHLGFVLAAVATGLLLFVAPSAVVLGITARRHPPRASKGTGSANVRVDVDEPEIHESGDAEPIGEPLDAEAGEVPVSRQHSSS